MQPTRIKPLFRIAVLITASAYFSGCAGDGDASSDGGMDTDFDLAYDTDADLPMDCQDLLDSGQATSGVYTVQPNTGIPPFQVYCDMTTDDGGWAKILQYAATPIGGDIAAVGTIAVDTNSAAAKLSDEQINALADEQGEYRLTGSQSSQNLYIVSEGEFADDELGWGIGNAADNQVLACMAADFSTCLYVPITTTTRWLETNHWLDPDGNPLSGNTCDRYFADFNEIKGCFGNGDNPNRCLSSGLPCGHTPHLNATIMLRRFAP